MKHVNNSSANKWVAVAFVVSLLVPGFATAEYNYSSPSSSSVSSANSSADTLISGLNNASSKKDEQPKTVEDAKEQLANLIGRLKITEAQKKQAFAFFANVSDIGKLSQAIVQLRNQDLEEVKDAKEENDRLEAAAKGMSTPPGVASNLNTGSLTQECGKSEVEGQLTGWTQIMQSVGDFSKFTREALKGISKDNKEARDKALDEAIAKLKGDILASIESQEKGDDYSDKLDKAIKAGSDVAFKKYFNKANRWAEEVKKKKSLALLDSFLNSVAGKRERADLATEVNEKSKLLRESMDKYLVAAEGPVNNAINTLTNKCVEFKGAVLGGDGTQQPGQTNLRGKQLEAVQRFQAAFEAQPTTPGAQVLPAQQDTNFVAAMSSFAGSLARKGRQLLQGADCDTSSQAAIQGAMQNLKNQAAQLDGVTDPETMINIASTAMQNFGSTFQQVNTLVNRSANACTAWSKEAKRLDTNVQDLDKQIAQARQQGVGPQAGGFGGPGPQQPLAPVNHFVQN